MSKDRTKIPVLKGAVKDIAKGAQAVTNFRANQHQERVKAKFFRRLEEMSIMVDKETVFSNIKLIVQLAGTDRITEWMEDPAFVSWFTDDYWIPDTISSMQAQSVNIISGILNDDGVSPGDRLKAARMLLELGDQFPGRKSEVRFLDDRINSLSESDTDKEIKQLEAQLNEDD